MTQDERRESQRVPVVGTAQLRCRHVRHEVKVYNLGLGGVFVCTGPPLPAGALVQVSISLPGAPEPIDAEGRVVWSNAVDTPDLPAGMGIHFTDIAPEDRDRLNRSLAALV